MHFIAVVALHLFKYRSRESRYEKTTVIRTILNIIDNAGGRFLKVDPRVAKWYTLKRTATLDKIGHAMRDNYPPGFMTEAKAFLIENYMFDDKVFAEASKYRDWNMTCRSSTFRTSRTPLRKINVLVSCVLSNHIDGATMKNVQRRRHVKFSSHTLHDVVSMKTLSMREDYKEQTELHGAMDDALQKLNAYVHGVGFDEFVIADLD